MSMSALRKPICFGWVPPLMHPWMNDQEHDKMWSDRTEGRRRGGGGGAMEGEIITELSLCWGTPDNGVDMWAERRAKVQVARRRSCKSSTAPTEERRQVITVCDNKDERTELIKKKENKLPLCQDDRWNDVKTKALSKWWHHDERLNEKKKGDRRDGGNYYGYKSRWRARRSRDFFKEILRIKS